MKECCYLVLYLGYCILDRVAEDGGMLETLEVTSWYRSKTDGSAKFSVSQCKDPFQDSGRPLQVIS